MKSLGIIGSVGIPANYGGFETLVEYLTKYLNLHYDITVYCSSKAYKKKHKTYNNVSLKYIGLRANGIQSILYDFFSLIKARKNDIILILGVSGCIFLPLFRFFNRRSRIIINIDGLEHSRAKWNFFSKSFLKISEIFAIKFSDKIIADNVAIKKYIYQTYNIEAVYIAYAGDQVTNKKLDIKIKNEFSIPENYALKVCRIEPENNIELIINAFVKSNVNLIIIGNWNNSSYGKNLRTKYRNINNIQLLDPIYNQSILNQIRSNCFVYLHGHSAGGTNPALVEAMNLGLPIFTYNCEYNVETTYNSAKYFSNSQDIIELLDNSSKQDLTLLGKTMKQIAIQHYSWIKISTQYLELINSIEIS